MKNGLIVAALMMLTTTAFAQDAAPAKTTLEFDAQQLQWLSQAINELPKKIADPFIADMNRQLTERQKVIAATEKAKADAAAKKK